jgi:hypothetical protein
VFNYATGEDATIGGGISNRAAGLVGTVGGGGSNYVDLWRSTVGGGAGNHAVADGATVGGGVFNHAYGEFATVPGGYNNDAVGDYSFAGGYRAKTESDASGSFVWGDSNDFEVWSHAANEFVVRATGGFWFISGIDGTGWPNAGYHLASGSSSWSQLSDRNAKSNFAPVDGREVLNLLAEIPIETWSYKTQDANIRHIGPIAQDFYAAYGLGLDELHIDTVDLDGVSLAAAQGLYEISQEQAQIIESLREENSQLKAELDSLDSRMDALERSDALKGVNLTGIFTGGILAGVVGFLAPKLRGKPS